MADMSWQVLAGELRLFVAHLWPAAVAFVALSVTWLAGRSWGRYTEQRRIRKHLPEIQQAELAKADKRIKDLEGQVEGLTEAAKEARMERRFVRARVQGLWRVLEGRG